MIRNEDEYKEAVARMQEETSRLQNHQASLEKEGLSEEQIKRLTDPMLSFHQQLVDDIDSYERLKRGDFDVLNNLYGLGRTLIGVRIYLNLSQSELADKLGVDQSQVSRDERNEYHNISVTRLNKVLDVFSTLGVTLSTQVNINSSNQKPSIAA